MLTTIVAVGTGLLLAAQPAAKVPPPVAKEMTEAIVAVNKALGLESWEAHGVKPCVDRGGEGAGSKDVSAEDTRTCAQSAIADNFPGLGKTFALGILMAPIGPVTVVAFGLGDLAGWGAYSCDPGRKCLPAKIDPGTKWGKRLYDRRIKACQQATTVWFPADARACEGAEPSPPPAQPTAPPPAKP
ncbi:MAG TPA: hypothetical protein VNO55_19490 [Polyangia bacterium]|nr:hypothetical protein [Polyangia bacterium]